MDSWLLTKNKFGATLIGTGIHLESNVLNRICDDFEKITDAFGIKAILCVLNHKSSAAIQINAQGQTVVGINTDFLWRVKDDSDLLTFVIAHELAHLKNGDFGKRGHEIEFAADKLAVEMMLKSGFNSEGAKRFFEIEPRDESETHPSSKDRIRVLTTKR